MQEISAIITRCFEKVIQRHLFELDTSLKRQEIICEFVEECALNGHGIQAEVIEKDMQFYGVDFIHENGHKGTITLGTKIKWNKDEENG